MGRKRAAIGAALVGASASRRLILFGVGGFVGRNGLLDILKLIFNTAKYQGIDYKRQSALEKRLGTTFC